MSCNYIIYTYPGIIAQGQANTSQTKDLKAGVIRNSVLKREWSRALYIAVS